MKLSLGFSPCPNDSFIFDALVNKKINTGGLDFDVSIEDVETLNEWALAGKLDITKLSFPAFFQSLNSYILLNSGSALGKGVGPLLISKKNIQYSTLNIQDSSVVLPGKNTTANLLFSFAYPQAINKQFMRFDKIEDFVLLESKAPPSEGLASPSASLRRPKGEAVLGVIIHESRFTYQQKGLHKILDLGEYWEEKMNLPIPLGGIAIKRSIDHSISLRVDRLIRQSLEYAFAHYPVIPEYAKQHSQTMSEAVMKQHIDLYVNNYSLNLGEDGKAAIEKLYAVFSSIHHITHNLDKPITLFLS